jgi:hypothetical protein
MTERGYGFTPEGGKRIVDAVRKVERYGRSEVGPRRRFPIMEGDSGAMLVGFTIVDASDCGLCTATAEVAINFGTTPELDSYDQFTVYDFGGCRLNEPVDWLIGRFGWAVYGTRVGNGACPGLPETAWWIIDLCEQEEECA